MKKNFLLTVAMLLAASTATQAQVVMSEDFSAPQTKTSTDVGYYEFINTQEGDEREVTDGRLHFYNVTDVTGQNWQRAVKFRNLPIQENTSYRVTFKLMGSNTYYDAENDANVRCQARYALMQGGENLDMGFLASDGTQQLNDISYFQEPTTGYYTYTGMFYYTTDAAQKAWYAENNPGKDELPATYFLTLNVYNPGDFYIDDVVVEQSNVQGVTYRDDVIRVNFGYAINTADLLGGKDRVLLPADCVTVKLGGKQVNILTVELLKDGNFYIFLDDEYPDTETADVKVSFTNPTGDMQLQYAAGKTPGGAVLNFTDEAAVYDANMPDVYSWAFVTPTLIESDPEDGSFNLPLSMKEFRLTFDKAVDCSLIEARLEGEKLAASPAEGTAETVTFSRSGADLAAGEYKLNVTKIYPEVMLADDIYGEASLTLTFGAVNSDPSDTVRVVMTDGFEEAGAGGYPVGWQVMSDGNLKSTAADGWGSGSRLMNGFTGSDFTTGLYLSGRSGSESYAYYGANEPESEKLHLQAGKYQLSFRCAAWDTQDVRSVKVQVCDPADQVLAGETYAVNPGPSNNNKDVSTVAKFEVNFRAAAEGDYVLKFQGLDASGNNGGWGDAILLGAVQVKYLPAAAGVDETNLLNTALAEAKEALENNAAERYAGVDYDNLKAVIEKHDGKATVYTAPSVFHAAAAELNAATDALKNHRSLCDTYDPLVDNAKYARDQRTGTKFERHESYAAIEAAIAQYEGQVLTDNAELQEAITVLQNTTAAVTNVERVVENYTASMVSAIATLKKIEGDDSNAELAETVSNLLTDDDAVKSQVKTALTQALYTKLSDPNNDLFSMKIDDATLEEYVDSFNVSVFIANPELYYTSWDDKAPASVTSKPDPSSESLPGWTISNVQRGWDFAYHYPWGANAQYAYNEATCPNANGMIAAWTSGFDLTQTVANVPAGKYTLYVGIGERGGNATPTSYIFANDVQQVIPVIAGSLEPTDNAAIEDVVVTDGTLNIGAHIDATDHVFINCFHLILKAAAPGYDYAAGLKEFLEGVDLVSNAVEVSRVELFDMGGRRVSTPQHGIFLVKKTMADGTVHTEKVIK